MTADRIPEDVRKLAAGAANDLHPFVEPSDRTVCVIARAILADRAAARQAAASDVPHDVVRALAARAEQAERWQTVAEDYYEDTDRASYEKGRSDGYEDALASRNVHARVQADVPRG